MNPNFNQSNRPMYPEQVPPQGAYPPTGTSPITYPKGSQTNYIAQTMVQPASLFGGMQFIYVEDPMMELASCPSLLIRQEPEFLEAITGCEQPNIYHIFGNSPLGFRYLFKCKEKSNCCSRRFCPSTNRPLDLDIIHCSSFDQLGMNYTTPFATMNKPCKCTICCLCRPEIDVILNSTSQAIGKIKHICTICDPTFDVYNSAGNLRFTVTASCCQCALLCPGFLAKTSQGVFDILENGQNVGRITKEPANVSELVTDADSYVVNFPASADANDKLLLTGLALMIDYQYFETDADEERKGKKKSSGGGLSLNLGGGGLKIKKGGKKRRK